MGGERNRELPIMAANPTLPTKETSGSYPQLCPHPVGQKIERIYTDRLAQFTAQGGLYASSSLFEKMYFDRATQETGAIEIESYSVPDGGRPAFKDVVGNKDIKFRPTKVGESFGPSWSTHWFKITMQVPKEIAKYASSGSDSESKLEFHWDSNSEGLVWSEDGVPLQGLTGGGERIEWDFPSDWVKDGKKHVFYVEMACNGMFGLGAGDTIAPPDMNRYFQLAKADLVAVNLVARALRYDFWIIGDAAREFPDDTWQKHEALKIANDIMDAFIADNGSQESIRKGRKIAATYLGNKVDSADVYKSGKEAIVYGIGHCHIDTCWLWPWDETKRKVARSWSNQCNLMDKYPEHRFACSQAQQFKWLKELYPPLFDRVKSKVKEGKFQPIGGSWVEHDTNLPSGESLTRQFIYGQRFFQENFGKRCETFWLPDTFGYSSQLPQLCRLAGMPRFFTQKLSWNNINNFPHTTFNWVSLDGSQVLCHMTPAETYTADAHFGDVKRSITQHKSMNQDKTSLLVFGKGDGGGGPTFEHLEKLRRCRGLSDEKELLPRVEMGHSVDDFFAQLQKKASEFVTWYGELYFELHRGTYTTQANNKRNNRKTEIMMYDIEYLSTLASLQDSKFKYPKKDIDFCWEAILLCQFHDCLPGSSIEMCYDDSDKLYAQVYERGEKMLENAMKSLGLASASQDDYTHVLNNLDFARSYQEHLPIGHKHQHSGVVLAGLQQKASGSGTTGRLSIEQVSEGVFVMSNDKLNVKVDGGAITSIFDKTANREIIPNGAKANQYVIFDDKPLYWQAWDVEVFHLESRKELKSESSKSFRTETHVGVVFHTKISDKSSVESTISLTAASESSALSMISIEANVQWHEDKKFLKVEFPVDIVNTEASYETQYGIIRRPTHYNTTWDMAKFEVCCHKWADLSENGYGVSILNDSKYGFATCGNVMRLSLLRAPKAPDAHADMGHHKIKFAILPHAGPLDHRTVRAARSFNYAPHFVKQIKSSVKMPHFTISGADTLVIDAVKRGDDDEDVSPFENIPKRKGRSIVVRVYESMGGRASGKLNLHNPTFEVKAITKVNILEDESSDKVSFSGSSAEITLRPFEVATYRLELA